MKLGLFLSIGESFQDFKRKGQYDLIVNYLLKNYCQHFDRVYVFSYGDEQFTVFDNVFILPNKWHVNRFLYSVFLPLFYPQIILSCHILRGLQLTGGLPGLLSKICFCKRFVINYGYDYQKFAQIEGKYLQLFLYKIIKYPILLLADKIIVTAKYLINDPNHFVISHKKIAVIPNGVDTLLFKHISLKKISDILYVGRLEKQKNLKNLIQAAWILRKFQLKLIFIGQGSQYQELIDFARSKKVNLKILSPVPHNELPKYMNKSIIFVLPSLIEGQPKVLLEALSCGLPIVASNIIAHQEIITDGKNGILRGVSADELADGIVKLLKNPNLRVKLAINARQTAIEKFDLQIRNQLEINLLKDIATLC